ETFAVSLVLWRLMAAQPALPAQAPLPAEPARPAHPAYDTPACAAQLLRLASRTAINRTVAGVHFPVDSVAGQLLGLTLADYLRARSTYGGGATYTPWLFDGTQFPLKTDFDFRTQYDTATGNRATTLAYVTPDSALTADESK